MIRLTFTSFSSAIALMLLVACSGASSSETGQLAPSVTSGGEAAKGADSNKATTSSPSTASANSDAGAADGGEAKQPNDNNNGDQNGDNGEGNRVSVGEHCCFNGRYLKCPDANACFGGFDINACLQACNPLDPCFEACFDKLNKASAPKGCDANAAPPPGVDCANGQIDL